jgi:acyl-coenzyme A synthetase/AMP-(fatty) acid ligase
VNAEDRLKDNHPGDHPDSCPDEQIEELISIGAALAREAELQGNAIAVECEGDSVSWEQLHRRTNRIARGLAAKGVSEGDFLTIALPNSVGFVEACYAAWKLGAVPQPVSYRLPAGELRAIVELANSPVVSETSTRMPGGPSCRLPSCSQRLPTTAICRTESRPPGRRRPRAARPAGRS